MVGLRKTRYIQACLFSSLSFDFTGRHYSGEALMSGYQHIFSESRELSVQGKEGSYRGGRDDSNYCVLGKNQCYEPSGFGELFTGRWMFSSAL